jgi:3-deoxy-manno-octulosonate cytidylyltransferase (CMP-KDO synthetase)
VIHTGSNPPNNPKIKAVAIIPARYESVRLPGKALLEIAGKPMICWVAERALAARRVSGVIVATDDQRIFDAVKRFGFEAVMTGLNHASGTDRIAEVAETLDDADIIVNVQGDEPTISPETIDAAVAALTSDPECGIATTWEPMESAADVLSPDVVKIVVDEDERAVYFSRSPVPYPRDAVRQHGSLQQALEKDSSVLARFRKHTGLYVYRREVLLAMARWPQSELEVTESLEQLRALEHGVKIKAIKASTASIGVDTAEDLERVKTMFRVQALA